MDTLQQTKELDDSDGRNPLGFFARMLGYPYDGVRRHKNTVALGSLPAIQTAYAALKKTSDSRTVEHHLYDPLCELLNAICAAPRIPPKPSRRTPLIQAGDATCSMPPTPISPSPSWDDSLGLSFIVSAYTGVRGGKDSPDLAMILSSRSWSDDAPSYADILIPIEVKGPKNNDKVEYQVAKRARAVLTAQCDRNFALCLDITFKPSTACLECRVWYFDHSGVISSDSFNIFKERELFIWLVRRLTDLLSSEMGFNSTLKPLGPLVGPQSHQEFSTTVMDEGKEGQRPVHVITERVLRNTRSVRGRATRCFRASVGSTPCILKLSWQDPARRPKEVTFYQWIEEYKIGAGVAHYIAYDEGIRTSELRGRVRSGDDYVFEDRVLCRLVLSTVGRPLEEFVTLKELFGAIHDCVMAHRKLVECPKKILHRDISVNNILLPNEDSPPVGHRGFLIDFDYAKSLADESNDDKTLEPASGAADDSSDLDGSSASKHSEASKHRQRTGTTPFMARDMLDGDTQHTFKHDLESFFWVLLYLLMLPSEIKSEHAEKAAFILEDLFHTDMELVSGKKYGLLRPKQKLWINPKYSVVARYMKELKSLVRNEWAIVDGTGTGDGLTYDGMLDVLNRALGALEESNPRREVPVSWQRLLPKTGAKRSRSFASSPSSASLEPSIDPSSGSGGSSGGSGRGGGSGSGSDEESRPAKKRKGSPE